MHRSITRSSTLSWTLRALALIVVLGLLSGLAVPALAQTQMVIWSFPEVLSSGDNVPLGPTGKAVVGTPTLRQRYQIIDGGGKAGLAYTDRAGVAQAATRAIAWNDIKGDGPDAALFVELNTTRWRDLSLRFDYRGNNATPINRFDLSYSTDGGATYVRILNNEPLVGTNAWASKTVSLASEPALNNQASVLFRLDDFEGGTGDGEFRMDNVEFAGQRIAVAPGDPTITEATPGTRVNLPATVSGTLAGVIDDPTDPAATVGLVFTIDDSNTPLANLTVTASSNNASVVPTANLVLSGVGSQRTLTIRPVGVGFANLAVTVSDGTGVATYTIAYAASAAAPVPSTTRFHAGASDASAAQSIDGGILLVGNDEDQVLRLYDRATSGLPVAGFDVSPDLALTDVSGGVAREVDIEGSMRVGNRVWWVGSHSNSASGAQRPNRRRLFATDLSGTGAATTLTVAGSYAFLRDDLVAWDQSNGHGRGANFYGFAAAVATGVAPESPGGFNIEGLALAPGSSTTAYLAFRAPLVGRAAGGDALLVPVTNFTTLLGAAAGSATFGTPISLALDGRGIREIARNASDDYLVVAGPTDDAGTFQLYAWDGSAGSAPVAYAVDLAAAAPSGSYEAIVEVPNPLTSGATVDLLLDNGGSDWYGDGRESKSLLVNHQKFVRVSVVLGAALPVELLRFAAFAKTDATELVWSTASERDVDYFAIERSGGGEVWTTVGRVLPKGAPVAATDYRYADHTPPAGTSYYRLRVSDLDGSVAYSRVAAVTRVAVSDVGTFTLAPNPASGWVTVSAVPSELPRTLILMDATGRRVRSCTIDASGGASDLDLAGLVAGCYTVTVASAAGTQAARLVVQ